MDFNQFLSLFTTSLITMVAFIVPALGIKFLLKDRQKTSNNTEDISKDPKITKYSYVAKSHMMTRPEENFFITLNEIFSQKFYVFPQVHLSKLLNHKIKGQSFYGAFLHINGKSVDFVLCRKADLKPICAVELDDYTHNWDNRKTRDSEVERMFEKAKLPLIRISRPQDLTRQEIINIFHKKITETNLS